MIAMRIVTDDQDSILTSHSTRMKAVDELLRSHTYAAEMRRAAKSASTWLRSIDRLESASDENDLEVLRKSGSEAPSQPSERVTMKTRNDVLMKRRMKNFKHVDKMDIVALRAMLHSAELKAKEKEDMALRLNEELSQCRAEIGRLKTASRAEVSCLLIDPRVLGALPVLVLTFLSLIFAEDYICFAE